MSDNIAQFLHIKVLYINVFPSHTDDLTLDLAIVGSLLGGILITLAGAVYFCFSVVIIKNLQPKLHRNLCNV